MVTQPFPWAACSKGTSLSVKKFFLISSLNLPLCDLRPFPLFLHLSIGNVPLPHFPPSLIPVLPPSPVLPSSPAGLLACLSTPLCVLGAEDRYPSGLTQHHTTLRKDLAKMPPITRCGDSKNMKGGNFWSINCWPQFAPTKVSQGHTRGHQWPPHQAPACSINRNNSMIW